MIEETKNILDEIQTIIQQKPFDYGKAEDLIDGLNLEKAPIELEGILLDCINNEDNDARVFAYEYLYYFDSEAVFQAALLGTVDDDDLVQMCAIEILGNLAKIESLPFLEKALKANDPHVRCFAAESIGFIDTDEAKVILEKRLDKETDSFAKVGIYSALHFLGDEAMLSNIIALLDDSYHLTIIRSLRVLEDCINQANKEMIKSSTKNLLERDIPISVKDAAEIVLEKLKRE
ncbi:HEAT repeat domain-containing protein [Listeria innocua]|uniref:HEAT repeat domain-containing protein n=1 Tax=Listeria TaxID=1637 RepID=UPI000F147ED1|nr:MULTISPECIES: HEAT repeat domain-containing protein [Listeria]EAD5868560.1 HEAT repeat domain-containing protein [Listeria innocua]EAF5676994.1 HEAT repeat domain-containing protein [Listeria innocua]EDO1176724.1 HEAT repeat domain-containing protein [Listeria innocua]EHF3600352.1 HEAT repeat domain-containing protein [Listeria innocua]EHF3615307.1 HEAT repeat domain-containing protein [Listeria innocua]